MGSCHVDGAQSRYEGKEFLLSNVIQNCLHVPEAEDIDNNLLDSAALMAWC